MNKGIQNIITSFLVTIFIWIGIQITANAHYHKMPDGTVICHSHPFQSRNTGSPFESHHHSKQQFLIIQQINFLLFVFGIFMTLMAITILVRALKIPRLDFQINPILIYSVSGRAPPYSL